MISLKKHIDQHQGQILRSTIESYLAAVAAMGKCGAQACPPLSEPLQQSLINLSGRISADGSPQAVAEAGQSIEKELLSWGGRAAEYYQQKTTDVKEIMMVLVNAAQKTGRPSDQKYSSELNKITARLQGIAALEDLTVMRQSLMHSASELKSSVEQMTRESQDSLQSLRAELAAYEQRLQEADGLAMRDELTGLDNRRGLEATLDARITKQNQFSLLMIDLNGFKAINDSHGHMAGDQLLKQFAGELRSAGRATDHLARWGGDEFVVVVDGNQPQTHAERIRRWVLGSYTIQANGAQLKVDISAAIGVAVWSPGQTVAEVFARADMAMYGQKQLMRTSVAL